MRGKFLNPLIRLGAVDDFEPGRLTNAILVSHFSLADCRDCGLCTRSCPSARHGGIDPHSLVNGLLEDRVDEDVWDCLLCYICEDVCPVSINLPQLVTRLRYRSSQEGCAPQRFARGAQAFLKEGRGFPAGPRVAKTREELGLPPLPNGDRAMRELGKVVSRTRFSYD